MLVATQTLAGCDRTAPPTVPQVLNPQAGARQALLYVSDTATNSVSIYSYPRLKLTGKLFGIKRPAGLCVDPRTGDVWVVSELAPEIIEFPHGGTKRMHRLDLGYGFEACAVDASGNLAVARYNNYDDPGALFIFKNGRGKPAIYDSPKMFYYVFVGYDSSGNAFVDGGWNAKLEELPAGGEKLKNVTPKGLTLRSPGGVQYDGTNLAVGNAKRGVIYEISNRTIVGKTKLNGACVVEQFFVDAQRGDVVAPSHCHSKGEVLIYDYPAGGNPIARITGFTDPFAAVVSP
ncbi:MAG: hypothetical protein ABSD52_14540 [Candidatus Cybelea sp.]|jgi:hypothetical protein